MSRDTSSYYQQENEGTAPSAWQSDRDHLQISMLKPNLSGKEVWKYNGLVVRLI